MNSPYHYGISLLFFLLRESRFNSYEWRFALRLEPRKELEEMAPMMVINPECTSFIASPHEEKAHLSILKTPIPLPHVRLANHRV